MKKFLALALILTLALSVSVFAEKQTDRIVGNKTENPQYKHGVTELEFATNDNSVDIAVKVTSGAYESRYAVDIEYEPIAFNVVGSDMVWDVDALEYVIKQGSPSLGAPAPQSIKVLNRSDKSVTVSAAVTRVDEYEDAPLTVNANCDDGEIEAATPGIEVENLPFESVVISLTADNWTEVANYFATILDHNGASVTIATVSLTIDKN